VPNEFIAAELKKVGVVVKNLVYEVDKSDGLMSNVRVCTFECRDVEEVPDTMQWRFDGLTGHALLFVRGRRPRCHRCGDRSHKFATCTATASYASVMRAENMEDDDGDKEGMQTVEAAGSVDVSPPAGPTVMAVKQTSESGPESSHNAAMESTLAVSTETAAETDPAADTETGSSSSSAAVRAATGRTVDPPEHDKAATSAATASVTTQPSEASSSDTSDGDDEMSDLDGGTSTLEAGGPAVDADGFRKPTDHVRRQRRSKKRTALLNSDTNDRPKKSKARQSASDTDTPSQLPVTEDDLDPTRRRNSRSKIPTSRRQ